MIVACPSCETRFNLDPAKLLPAGRNVRCAQCGHRWRQMPEGLEAPAPEPAPAVEAPPPEPAAPAPPQAEALPEEAETHPPSPPETPAEMAESLAAIAEQVANAAGESASEAAPRNPMQRLRLMPGSGPGPITVPPRMRPMRPAKRNRRLGLVLIVGLIVGLLAAAVLFKDVIARTVPGAAVIYALFGLSTDNPAADLEISNVTHSAVSEGDGQQVLQVTATLFNLSEDPVPVPPLMVVPLDSAGAELEPFLFRLKETVAQPGQNIKFQKSFDNWPQAATSFKIVVADAL